MRTLNRTLIGLAVSLLVAGCAAETRSSGPGEGQDGQQENTPAPSSDTPSAGSDEAPTPATAASAGDIVQSVVACVEKPHTTCDCVPCRGEQCFTAYSQYVWTCDGRCVFNAYVSRCR